MGDVEETITADTGPFVDAMEAAIAAAKEFEDQVQAIRDALAEMDAAGEGAEVLAGMLEGGAEAAQNLAQASDIARDKLAEIGAASAGIEAVDATLVQGADQAEAFAAAAGQVRNELAEIGGVGGAATAELAAGLGADAAAAKALQEELAGVRDKLAETDAAEAIEPVVALLHNAAGMYDNLQGKIHAVSDAEAALKSSAAAAAASMRSEWNTAVEGGLAGSTAMDAARNAVENTKNALAEAEPVINAFEGTLDDAANVAAVSQVGFQNLADTVREAGAGAEISGLAFDEVGSTLNDSMRAASDAGRTLGDVGHAIDNVAVDATDSVRGLQFLGGAFHGFWNILSDGEGILGTLKNAFAGIGNLISSGFSQGLSAAGSAIQSAFSNIAQSAGRFVGIAGLIAGAVAALSVPVTVLLSGFSAAAVGVGAFAALALPTIMNVVKGYQAISAAQKQIQTAQTPAQHQAGVLALAQAWAGIPKFERPAEQAITSFMDTWHQMSKAFAPTAFKAITPWLQSAGALLKSIRPLADAAATGIGFLGKQLDKAVNSPAWKRGVGQLVPYIKEAIPAIGRGLWTLGVAFSNLFTTFSPKQVAHGITEFFGVLADIVHAFGNVAHATGNVIHAFANIGQAVRNVIHAVGNIVHAFENVGHAAGNIGNAAGGIVHSFAGIGNTLKGTTSAVTSVLKGLPSAAQGALAGLQSALKSTAGDAITGMVGAIRAGVSLASSAVKNIGSAITSAAGNFGSILSAAGHAVVSGLTSAISAASGLPPSAIRSIGSAIVSAAGNFGGLLVSAGAALISGLVSGIESMTGAVVSAAEGVAQAAASAARSVLGIFSPSTVFQKIGAMTVLGFIRGLLGGKGQIGAVTTALFGHPFKDVKIEQFITKLKTEVAAAYRAGVIGSEADTGFTRFIRRDNRRLEKLAKDRYQLENNIKAADALAASVQSEAVTSASIGTSFGNTFAGKYQYTPTYATIQQAMKAQLHNIRAFTTDIKKLKREGLDETSIKQLLSMGVTAGLPAAQQMLAGGRAGVREIAKLQNEIAGSAKLLGIRGANAAYEAGSQIGKGLAAGLKHQLNQVEASMRRIAKTLIDAIRTALRVRSPSQVMADIGMQTVAGLAAGMDAGAPLVAAAARRAADSTMRPYAAAGSRAGGSYGAGGPAGGTVNIHTTLNVDGKALARTVQTHQLRHARRNIATGLKLASRGI